jgi:hypothetical protein
MPQSRTDDEQVKDQQALVKTLLDQNGMANSIEVVEQFTVLMEAIVESKLRRITERTEDDKG